MATSICTEALTLSIVLLGGDASQSFDIQIPKYWGSPHQGLGSPTITRAYVGVAKYDHGVLKHEQVEASGRRPASGYARWFAYR